MPGIAGHQRLQTGRAACLGQLIDLLVGPAVLFDLLKGHQSLRGQFVQCRIEVREADVQQRRDLVLHDLLDVIARGRTPHEDTEQQFLRIQSASSLVSRSGT